ncbi:MAG: hypothetical protein ACXACP_10450 [Candidatus Hodarchaeales archaeon]|jgi:hypothetical protein
MGRNLEDQMRLSIRAILSKQMAGGGEKNRVIASFVSDDNGFPLTGMKRSDESITEMGSNEFEQVSAIIPQIWDSISGSMENIELLEFKHDTLNHVTVGLKGFEGEMQNFELLVTKLDELYISSLYLSKKK